MDATLLSAFRMTAGRFCDSNVVVVEISTLGQSNRFFPVGNLLECGFPRGFEWSALTVLVVCVWGCVDEGGLTSPSTCSLLSNPVVVSIHSLSLSLSQSLTLCSR